MPVRGRKFHQKNHGIGRSKMFLADNLGWLPGYPLELGDGHVRWMSLPNDRGKLPESIQLTRENLHEATYTWKKLNNRFPHALPAVIPNLNRWQSHLPILLDWLKQAIHHGKPLPDDLFSVQGVFSPDVQLLAKQVQKRWPVAKKLLIAFGWLHLLQPHLLNDSLSWLSVHQTQFEIIFEHSSSQNDAIIYICKLWELHRRESGQNIESLIKISSHSLIWHVARNLEAMTSHISAWEKTIKTISKKKPSRQKEIRRPIYPAKVLGFEMDKFINHLLLLNKNSCQKTLEAFETIYPISTFDQWANWHSAVLKADRKALDLFKRWERQTVIDQITATNLQAEFISLKEKRPPIHNLKQILSELKELSKLRYHDLLDCTPDYLASMSQTLNGNLLRVPALLALLTDINWTPVQTLVGFAKAHTSYCRSFSSHPDYLQIWKPACEIYASDKPRYRAITPTDFIASIQFSAAYIDTIFSHWGDALNAHQFPPTAKNFDRFCDLYERLKDPAIALERTQHLYDEGYDGSIYDSKKVQIAHLLAPNGKTFAMLLDNLFGRDDLNLDKLKTVCVLLEENGWVGVPQALVQAGKFERLANLSKQIAMNAQTDLSFAPPNPLQHKPAPMWPSQYPADFHPALNTLNNILDADRALTIAQNILGKSFPNPTDLQNEIEFLENLVHTESEDPKLIGRLTNLKKHLANPQALSTKKTENLNQKLIRAVHEELLLVWEENLNQAIYSFLAQRLKSNNIPAELLSLHATGLIPNLLNLPNPYRDLGFQLLANRCGPRPWLMQNGSKNKHFVASLKRNGINMEPWLNPPVPQAITGKNGQEIILSFEEDPIEILHMGGYFNTCLSPGSFNFYSAIVNGIDINKHVLFARNNKGGVVGRCLIGLTEEGGIVTFHPYCHDGTLGFREIVQRCVQNLANKMKTIVLPFGQIKPIMTNSWYDDGPEDLTSSFKFLNHSSPFRKSLNDISPDQFVDAIKNKFVPLPLNGLTLALILNLSEVKNRPELIAELLPIMQPFRKSISDQTWLQSVKGLIHIGKHQEAKEILINIGVPYQLRMAQLYRDEGIIDFDLLHTMISIDPVLALQVIRKTRPQFFRSDLDEWFERAWALIRIYDRLNRPNKKKLLEEKWSKNIKKLNLP